MQNRTTLQPPGSESGQLATDAGESTASPVETTGKQPRKVPTGVLVLLCFLIAILLAAFVAVRWSKSKKMTLIEAFFPAAPVSIGSQKVGEHVELTPYDKDHSGEFNALSAALGVDFDGFEFDDDPLGGSWAALTRNLSETEFPSFDYQPTAADDAGSVDGSTENNDTNKPERRVSTLQGKAQRLELMPPAVREVDDQPSAPEHLELSGFGRLDTNKLESNRSSRVHEMESSRVDNTLESERSAMHETEV
jgi:hypothetical protein